MSTIDTQSLTLCILKSMPCDPGVRSFSIESPLHRAAKASKTMIGERWP
jgi:hypothetical protein